MKKYSISIILIKRVLLFLISSLVIICSSSMFTDIYLNTPLYTGIIFFSLIILSVIIGKRILIKQTDITIENNIIYFNKGIFKLSDLQSYNFENTGYIYKVLLKFSTKKIKLYIPIKRSLQYLEFKKDLEKKIKFINRTESIKIEKHDWYKTKFAKIYGYITILILFLWVLVMFIYPEKFKLSKLGLFLMVTAGLTPILIRIFGYKPK